MGLQRQTCLCATQHPPLQRFTKEGQSRSPQHGQSQLFLDEAVSGMVDIVMSNDLQQGSNGFTCGMATQFVWRSASLPAPEALHPLVVKVNLVRWWISIFIIFIIHGHWYLSSTTESAISTSFSI